MSTLYLDRRNLSLKIKDGALAIYQNGTQQTTIPLKMLQRLVVRGDTMLSTSVLSELTSNGIGFLSISGRRGDKIAQLTGNLHNDGTRRINQYRAYMDKSIRLETARRTVDAKLANQQRLVERLIDARPDERNRLTRAARTLTLTRTQLAESNSTDQLRGYEGAAAAAFFQAYASVLPPRLKFSGRNRRPPRDPVNACLSLAYTLLNSDAVHACHIAGLDPAIGMLHEPAFGRASMAADMIEPLRPHIDEWVWGLFRDRLLDNQHFSHKDDACLLIKNGRQIFYSEWEQRALALRRLLRVEAQRLARSFGESDLNPRF